MKMKMSKFQTTIGFIGMLVVLAFFVAVALQSCAPTDTYMSDGAIQINSIKTFIDEEHEIICYLARNAISCLPLP